MPFDKNASKIIKHGTAVARLVPVKRKASAEEHVAAIERIQELAAGLFLGRLKVKDRITEGRR